MKFESLEDQLVPIFPMQLSFNINTGIGNKRITRTQFPLTPAFCLTSHKVQGKTMSSGCIVDLSKPPTGKLDSSYAYVVLSRVKRLRDLYIVRPFDKTVLEYAISKDLIEENKRLEILAAS